MLEKVDLTRTLSREDYKRLMPPLQRRLFMLQRACKEAKLATIIVFEGWDSAGKGTAIRKLTSRMDPRVFSLHAIREPRTYEKQMPWMWRYWSKIPNWGEMAIFDRSWYGRVLIQRIEGLVTETEWRQGYRDINEFERALADDRYMLIKFFLHISKKEQGKRLTKMEKDALTRWKVESEDWEHHKKYDEYRIAVEEMLEFTETESGPWTLIEAAEKRWTRVKIFTSIVNRMEQGLEAAGAAVPELEKIEEAREEDEAPAGDNGNED